MVRARNLRNPDRSGEPDPYITLAMESIVPSLRQECTTKVHNDGGADAIWNATFNFDFVDQVEILMKVWDDDFGLDDLIGFSYINIVDVVRELGYKEEWFPIQFKQKGKLKPAGEILLRLSFEGYDKIRYPQYRPTLDGTDRVISSVVDKKPTMRYAQLPTFPDFDPLTMTNGRLHVTLDRAKR